MKVKILSNKKEIYNGILRKDCCFLVYKGNEEKEEPAQCDTDNTVVVVNEGLPQKLNSFEHTIVNMPLGWHKGIAHIYENSEQKLVIVIIEYFDNMSAILIKNKINDAFIAHKNILFSVGEKLPKEILELQEYAEQSDVYQYIQSKGVKYSTRVFE